MSGERSARTRAYPSTRPHGAKPQGGRDAVCRAPVGSQGRARRPRTSTHSASFGLVLDRLKRPDIPRRHKQLNEAHRSTHRTGPGPGSWKLTGQTTRAARPTRSAEITDLLQTSADRKSVV